MDQGTLGEVRDWWRTLEEVRGTLGAVLDGWGTIAEVRDESGDPRGALETGRVTLGKVRNGSVDPWGGPGRAGGPQGDARRVGALSGRTGTDRWTLG